MVDDEESQMEKWYRSGARPRSVEEMAEDIRRTPPHKGTEVLTSGELAERRKKSPPTCKSHDEELSGPHHPAPPPTTQPIKTMPTFPCWLCSNEGYVGRDCPEMMHSNN